MPAVAFVAVPGVDPGVVGVSTVVEVVVDEVVLEL